MEANVLFVVLKVEEQKLNDNPYKVDVSVVGSFNNLEDARKCKEAKDRQPHKLGCWDLYCFSWICYIWDSNILYRQR